MVAVRGRRFADDGSWGSSANAVLNLLEEVESESLSNLTLVPRSRRGHRDTRDVARARGRAPTEPLPHAVSSSASTPSSHAAGSSSRHGSTSAASRSGAGRSTSRSGASPRATYPRAGSSAGPSACPPPSPPCDEPALDAAGAGVRSRPPHREASSSGGRSRVARPSGCCPTSTPGAQRTWWREAGKQVVFRAVDGAKVPGADGRALAERYGLPVDRIDVVTQSVDVERLALARSQQASSKRDGRRAGARPERLRVHPHVGRLWALARASKTSSAQY